MNGYEILDINFYDYDFDEDPDHLVQYCEMTVLTETEGLKRFRFEVKNMEEVPVGTEDYEGIGSDVLCN